MPSGHHTLLAATVPHFHWAQAAPPQMEALALLSWLLGLPVPSVPQPRSTAHTPTVGACSSFAFSVSYGLCPGPTRTPQPAQGLLVELEKSVLSAGQIQLCARPCEACGEELGLAISPVLSPRSPTLGDPGTHFRNLHSAPGSATLPVSRSTLTLQHSL